MLIGSRPAGVLHKPTLTEKIGGSVEEMCRFSSFLSPLINFETATETDGWVVGKITHNRHKELEGQARKSGTHPAQHDITFPPPPSSSSQTESTTSTETETYSHPQPQPLPHKTEFESFPIRYDKGIPNLNAGTGGSGEGAGYGNDNFERGYRDTQPVGGDLHGYKPNEEREQEEGKRLGNLGNKPAPISVDGEGNSNAQDEQVGVGYDSMGGFPTGAPRGMARQYSMN
jgi:hypothetical protein